MLAVWHTAGLNSKRISHVDKCWMPMAGSYGIGQDERSVMYSSWVLLTTTKERSDQDSAETASASTSLLKARAELCLVSSFAEAYEKEPR
jgi:hypothetical protein